MPGTNAGTGQPISFKCAVARRLRGRHNWTDPPGHREIYRTGRERETNRGGIRMDTVSREYVCECGHVGWSKHKDLRRYPLNPMRREEP